MKPDPKKRFFVYFPFIVFLLYFAVDKVALLPGVKRLSQSDATYLYFDYKSELMDRLETYYRNVHSDDRDPTGPAERKSAPVRKKILVVLGSSRLLFFDYKTFARNFPDWEMFNFSAPVTTPAYYDFILQRILDRGIVPDLVLMEADPFQYNEGSTAFVHSNLAYSFDPAFILGHWSLFKPDEISYFFGRYLFAANKYPPDLATIATRLKNPKDRFLVAFDELDRFQRENNGAGRSIIPRENWYERDFTRLSLTAKMTIDWLYGRYTISRRQFSFLRELLGELKRRRVATVLIRPQVSRPMERLLHEDPRVEAGLRQWDGEFIKFVDDPDFRYLDLRHRDDYYCNTYVDGSHMSLDCYRPLMMLVMRQYLEMKGSF